MQTDYLNEILVSSSKNESNLPDLLKNVLDNKDYGYKTPCLYVEWTEGGSDDPMLAPCVLYSENLNPLLKIIGEDASKSVLEILSKFEEDYDKRQITRSVLYEIIQSLEKEGFKVLTAIMPTEWYNAFFVFKNIDEVIPHYLLHHFNEAIYKAEGWFDEFYSDYNKSLSEYLNEGYSRLLDPRYAAQGVDFNDRNQLKFILEEDEFSFKSCRDNLEILNLDELFFETAKKGLFAVKKFC